MQNHIKNHVQNVKSTQNYKKYTKNIKSVLQKYKK